MDMLVCSHFSRQNGALRVMGQCAECYILCLVCVRKVGKSYLAHGEFLICFHPSTDFIQL